MKEKIRKEYYRRVRLVLKSELNACNRINAINALAVPVVSYSFNIINWNMQELKNIDRKTRKLLTMERIHHPKADVDRLYLPRKSGGRGLTQIETTYKTTTIALDAYLSMNEDPMTNIIRNKHSPIHREAQKFKKELNATDPVRSEDDTRTKFAKRTKHGAKQQAINQLTDNWKEKALHGQYPKRLDDQDVDAVLTNRWLSGSGLKSETEGFIVAAQDQTLKTNYYRHKILKDGSNPLCRICSKYNETTEHLVSGCPELAKSEYITRHNRAAKYLHWEICRHYNIQTKDKYYEHEPNTVTENTSVTILWDMPIHTDKEIKANRPDIVIKDKKSKTCILVDMSVPSDNNISIKTTEKLSKYKDLEIEIEKMWNMKTTTVPVIIGALGMIKTGIETYIEKLPGNFDISTLQKTVLLGTAHILRRTLSIK